MQLLTTHWPMSSQSPSSRPPHPSQLPPVLLFSMTSYGLEYPWASLGQLSQLCPLPASCAPPASLLAGQYEKLKSPWLRISTAQQQLKHQCVINVILILNPKRNTIPATRNKINSTPAETRTHSYCTDLLADPDITYKLGVGLHLQLSPYSQSKRNEEKYKYKEGFLASQDK